MRKPLPPWGYNRIAAPIRFGFFLAIAFGIMLGSWAFISRQHSTEAGLIRDDYYDAGAVFKQSTPLIEHTLKFKNNAN